MRDIKTLMDPHDIVNPGHLVCGKTRFGINLDKNIMGVASKLMVGVKKLLPKDSRFESNLGRFYYNQLEEEKMESLEVTYGKGTE